ncbi:hypothetical protein Hanom_Chr11g01018511 [Helianthus anomalus]
MEDADLNKAGEDEAPELANGNESLRSEFERPRAYIGCNSKVCMAGAPSMCMENQKELSVPNIEEHVHVECFGNQEPPLSLFNEERELVGPMLSYGLEQGRPPDAGNRPSYITCRPKRGKKTKKRSET